MPDKVKCLLVDDEPANLSSLETLLRGDGIEILTADSESAVLELLQAHDFALALLNIHVPGMDGFALAELMRANESSKHIPIIFITAASPDEPLPMFRGYESGAVDVLFKPVNPGILRQKAEVFFQLQRQRQQLEQAVRAREDVLAIVSHDLRTPLSVVHTTASMLLNPKYQLTPQQIREQHERIRRNVDLMNRMIGDLMDMVALRGGKLSIDPKPIVINDVLREAIAAQEAPAREKGVTLAYDAGDDVMQAEADRGRLMQLFQNLLGNAVKFCKAGDRISVTSRARGNRAQIEIADSGPGIAADDLPHIFDPYYSASKKHQKIGTGLGLYISKGIVDAHGGQIRCGSEPGVGTTFDISLPLTP
ncbi:MAG TPA: hybrid sensor histidine kinase/response regulator [Steroidobacteraceae bacterium]|nr:hybrid sensor histidine kinase/response regulator [Steroidobacteraceae bacterium]